jgi:hypothetical protein
MTASYMFGDRMPRLADRFGLIASDLPDFSDYGGLQRSAVVSRIVAPTPSGKAS